MKGLIFDIQGYSIHDGSGCRTLVFLSGCPLRCAWCANPEGQLLRPRVMYREKNCTHTHYRCVQACPNGAIRIDDGDGPPLQFDRAVCERCDSMDCVAVCFSQALKTAGDTYSVDELMRILVRDQGFWGSQGGVTFSGGEPLLQAEFLLAALARCRASYIHSVVETCAHASTDVLLQVLQWTDAMFIDVKHMDTAAHRAETGVGNELILQNIEAVAAAQWGGRLMIRVPVVPGYNDTAENMRATAAFMAGLDLQEVNLLPFHRLGHSKYKQLGLPYKYAQVPTPSQETLRSYQRIFEAAGLRCYLGPDTPF
ncbi:MAG: 4-hydroxyphenylacetate decarboxylase activase [Anaerolineae bacterium]|nr:4-hydroxyphenylacetate decarboxylase activase [Anaerolineae bacterium]